MPKYDIIQNQDTINVYINFADARRMIGSQLYEFVYSRANQFLKPSKFVHTGIGLDKDWIVFYGHQKEAE